jgi:hypothetical protein
MLAKPVGELPDGPWSFEPKWDGFRTIVFRDGDEVELGSRRERPLTRYFPEVTEAVRTELPARCVVDAEIVVPDPDGRRLDFDALLLRIHPAASEGLGAAVGHIRSEHRGLHHGVFLCAWEAQFDGSAVLAMLLGAEPPPPPGQGSATASSCQSPWMPLSR